MRKAVAGIVAAFLLVACGQAEQAVMGDERAAEEAAAPAEAPGPDRFANVQAQSDAGAVVSADASPQAPPRAEGPAPTLYLAYSYQAELEIPSQRLSAVQEAHVRACQAAGPRVCQLIGSTLTGDPDSSMNGFVSLRAEPAWLRGFLSGLNAQAEDAGGRIVSQATTTEDLTRAIVDTEARLRAQTALRDRLQQILQTRPGRLSDLLEVERELARVQAEIDSVQSNLAVMRTRVAMSELTIAYRSAPRPVGSDTFEPLRNAFANFLKLVVLGFAAIVTFVAALVPFVVVGAPIVWGLLRWRRVRGGRFFGRSTKSSAAEEKSGAP